METKIYTIGEVARLSGVPVRRIRFYADRGLLSPAGRTDANYRLFTDADLVRLDLIGVLRNAGVHLDGIAGVLADRFPLADILRTRLALLETEIAAKKRVAAVLRATLRSDCPTNDELRRLWTMTMLSNAQIKAKVEYFVDEVSQQAVVDADLRRQMAAAMTPELPDDPTPEQIDAWNELIVMLQDRGFVHELQTDMSRLWTSEFRADEYRQAAQDAYAQVKAAMAAGHAPESQEGGHIAAEWMSRSAAAMNVADDQRHKDWLLDSYAKQASGRQARYRELLAVLKPGWNAAEAIHEWSWLNKAIQSIERE